MGKHSQTIHGELTLATFGQVLWVRVRGSTNREFVDMLKERVIELATPICGQPWIGVSDLLEWELGGPDALAGIKPLMEWYESHNRSHSVNLISDYVLHDATLKGMIKGIERHSERIIVHSVDAAIDKVCLLQPEFDPIQMRKIIYAADS